MKVIWEFLSFFIFLPQILRGFSTPIPVCKPGEFLETNVNDYLDCKVCVEQPHYDNCQTCCGSGTFNNLFFWQTYTSQKGLFTIHCKYLEQIISLPNVSRLPCTCDFSLPYSVYMLKIWKFSFFYSIKSSQTYHPFYNIES